MAYGEAPNEIVLDMAREVLPVVGTRRCSPASTAPTAFVLWDDYFDRLERLGLTPGCRSFPTVGLFDGQIAPAARRDGHGATASKSR